jgi:hypothetical protein
MADRKPGKPSISPTEAARAREALERLYETTYEQNKTSLGKALGISQLLAGTNDASIETVKRLARLEGKPLSAYLDETAPSVPDSSPFPSKERAAAAARGLLLADWAVVQMLSEEAPRGLKADPGPVFWFRRVEQLLAGGLPPDVGVGAPPKTTRPAGRGKPGRRTRRA